MKRVGFEFQINYHSAAELLLYPRLAGQRRTRPTTRSTGRWPAPTTTRRSRATRRRRPGLRPRRLAELYIDQRRDDRRRATQRTARSRSTPEMDVADPDRGGGDSGLRLPGLRGRPRGRVREEPPVRARPRQVRRRPGQPGLAPGQRRRPTSSRRRSRSPTATRRPSRSTPSASSARSRVHWQVNSGAEQHGARRREWNGGERYGGDSDVYYHHMRGQVTGTKPGDDVKVWFTGRRQDVAVVHLHAGDDTGNQVLIMAAEDYTGAAARGHAGHRRRPELPRRTTRTR